MSKLKGIIAVTLIVAVLVGLIALGKKETADETLVVYNWEDYIDSSVIDDFEEYYYEETGKTIKVMYSTFDTNETMLTKVRNGDACIDVAAPSEYAIERMMKMNLLYKFSDIEEETGFTITNKSNIDPYIETKINEIFGNVNGENLNDYFVPYMCGTLGILYNTDKVSQEELEEQGWGIMWNSGNNPDLEGKILMKDSVRDSYAAAICYAYQEGLIPQEYSEYSIGELISCSDPTMLALAEDLLNNQRSHLKGYEVDFGKDDMIAGTAYLCLAWSGDALYAIDEDPDEKLGYYLPEVNGQTVGNIWFDGWVIPTSARNKTAAAYWINYMCDPAVSMLNMLEIGYQSAIDRDVLQDSPEAMQYLIDSAIEYEELDANCTQEEKDEYIDDFMNNTTRYPLESTTLGVMKDYADNDKAVAMWERVKAESIDLLPVILIMAGCIAGVILLLYLFTRPKRYRKVATTTSKTI